MRNKRETFIVIAWCIAVMLITLIPYWYGSYQAPAGATYMGFIANNNDQSTYLAWIKQAADGKILLEDKFTTEFQAGLFFHPLFLITGWFSGITGIDALSSYHTLRIISGFFLMNLLYYFGCLFLKKFSHRFFFLVLASLSSGFGWLFSSPILPGNIQCLDLLAPEAITFLTILTKPLFSVSLILMLAIFMLMFKSYKSGKAVFTALAGLLGLILGLIHPYDMVSIYCISILYLILTKSALKQAKYFILFLVISLPAIIYQYLIFNFDPVFKEWSQKQLTLTPHPLSFVITYGLIGLFAVIYIIYIIVNKKNSKIYLFLISWIICALILVYLPFKFQRRLILGLHIPLCIFAAKLILDFILPFIKKASMFKGVREPIILAMIIVIVMPGNFVYIYRNMLDMKNNILNYCLPNEDLEALKWIDKNVPPAEIIIASPVISQYIPGLTGNKVYAGHYDQTIDNNNKIQKLKKFYSTDDPKLIISNWGERINLLLSQDFRLDENAKYVHIYFGPYEQSAGDPGFDEILFLSKEYQNNNVTIYKTALRFNPQKPIE